MILGWIIKFLLVYVFLGVVIAMIDEVEEEGHVAAYILFWPIIIIIKAIRGLSEILLK